MNYILVIRDLIAVMNPGPTQYLGWKVIGEFATVKACKAAAEAMGVQDRTGWRALVKDPAP